MPRPSPSKVSSPLTVVQPHRLSASETSDLSRILGYTGASQSAEPVLAAIDHVKVFLGLFKALKKRKTPRHQHYHKAFAKIRNDAAKLHATMTSLAGGYTYFKDRLIAHGVDPDAVIASLRSLKDTASSLVVEQIQIQKALESKGKKAKGPPKIIGSLRIDLARRLRAIFETYDRGKDFDREQRLLRFVEQALYVAQAVPDGFDVEGLLQDPGCASDVPDAWLAIRGLRNEHPAGTP